MLFGSLEFVVIICFVVAFCILAFNFAKYAMLLQRKKEIEAEMDYIQNHLATLSKTSEERQKYLLQYADSVTQMKEAHKRLMREGKNDGSRFTG